MRADELFDVSGAVTLVTGAASGLGLAMAEVMAINGARVVMADIAGDNVRRKAERLIRQGAQVEAAAVDVTDAARLRHLIDRIVSSHGRIDVVFANAGGATGPGFIAPAGQIENVSTADWEQMLNLNLGGVFTTLQAVVPHLKKNRKGKIIVTSSIGGLRSEPIISYAYVAAKSAVSGIIRQAALELAPFGIQVNGIAPGPFLTNINGGRLHTEVGERFAARVPMGRLGQPDEIKGAALLLASRASSYITGTIVSVDGGMIAQ